MIALALSLALVAGQDDAPTADGNAEYPARAVLEAFATACSGAENLAVAKASVEAAGWTMVPPDSDSPITRLVAFGKAEFERQAAEDGDELESELLDGGEYRTEVAGRTLYVAISGARYDTVIGHGCRVYDFEATAPIEAETLTDWAVRAPSNSQTLDGGLVKHVWNPGLKPGHMGMEVSFVPQDWPLRDQFPLSGLVIQADTVEFLDL
ncbi:MAG: hypothetical protein R3E02_01515 [Blastomonas sp.]